MNTVSEKGEEAIVLLSGGLDSAVALYWAVSQGWQTAAIEYEYYLRPERERVACRGLCDGAGIRRRISLPLHFIREVADQPEDLILNAGLHHSPQGYIPARNLLFYALAAHYAELVGARYIVGGHNSTDSESFPDAGGNFFEHLNALFPLALWSHSAIGTRIVLPLIALSKTEVVRLGHSLHVPFELTWSCYHDREIPCGNCASCLERQEAFAAAGVCGSHE